MTRRRGAGALALLATTAAIWVPVAANAPAAAGASSPPAVSAREALVIDADSGEVLYARASHRRVPMASTTKLMTALLTLERARLGQVFTVVNYPLTDVQSTAGLQAGEHLKVSDLLRAMLLPSANEAAQTLAVRVAGSESAFVAAMNARARELGLADTHYATPVGLDVAGNYSSAADLLRLAQIDLRNPFFARTVAMPSARLTSGAHTRVVINRNDLVGRYPWVDGVKTGHTLQAGYVLVGAAHRSGVHLLSVVLGAPTESDRDADTLALLRYGFSRYRTVAVVRAGQRLASVAIKFAGGTVPLVAASTIVRTLPADDRLAVVVHGVPANVTGPIRAGTREATATVSDRGRTIARVSLVTARAVPKPTLGQRLQHYATSTITVALLAGLLACSLLLAILQHRVTRRRRSRVVAGQEH